MACSFEALSRVFGDALLPIIPAGAKLSERSTLSEEHIGKIPGRYKPRDNTWAGFNDWSHFTATHDDYREWDRWPDVLVGLNLGNYVGIDIDIEDVELAEHVTEILLDCLPTSIIRTRDDSPRRMLIYKLKDGPANALERVTFIGYGMVEFLGYGKQAVLCGRHPKGGWQELNGELKEITLEKIAIAVERLYFEFDDISATQPSPGRENKPRVERVGSGAQSVHSMLSSIMGWQENGRHEALVKLSYGLVKDGVAPDTTTQLLYAVMHSTPEHLRDVKWNGYLKDLPRLVDGAVKLLSKDREDELCDFSSWDAVQAAHNEFPRPIGALGDITRNVIQASPHPNQVVAATAAIALVAGIAGRRFNVNGDGVNIYISLLMDSGMGKDIISQYIAFVLLRNCDRKLGNHQTNIAEEFMGAKRFTGPKALQKLLAKKRSNVCIFNEAGFLYQSGAGDAAGLQRIVLDLFTKSGATGTTAAEEYSDTDEKVETLFSPALTLVNESTPTAFLNVMSQRRAEESGEFGRMLLFRVDEKKSYFNHGKKLAMEDELYNRIQNLLEFCWQTQHEDDPEPVLLEFQTPSRLIELSNYYTDQYNRHRESDIFRAMAFSRAFQKVTRLAAISAIIDHESDYRDLIVGDEHLDWALRVIDFEDGSLDTFKQGGSEGPVEDIVKYVIAPVLHKLFTGAYAGKTGTIPDARAKRHMFTYTEASRLLHNNPRIREWSSRPGRPGAKVTSGLRKLLDYMTLEGYLVKVDTTKEFTRCRELWQCTREMEFLFEDQPKTKRRRRSRHQE